MVLFDPSRKKQKKTLEIFASIEHQRVQPNVITFSSLISACEEGKNPEQALEVFASMEHQRVQPNVIKYNSLISIVYVMGYRFDTILNSFDIKKTVKIINKHFFLITIFSKF